MSQHINFYNTKLVKPKDWFSLKAVAIVYVVAAGLMIVWYQQLNAEASIKEQARQTAQTQFEQMQKQLETAMSASNSVADVKAHEAEIKALQEKVNSQEKIIAAFEQTRSGKRLHVADYMAGLSHQTVQNLWLTGFKLDAFKNYLGLTGRAYKAELVPQYIEALSREPVFKGQLFGGLQIKEIEQANQRQVGDTQATRAEASTVAGANTANSSATNNPTNTSQAANASGGASTQASGVQSASNQSANTIKPMVKVLEPIQLIEFEIKGLEVVPNSDASAEEADKNVGEPTNG